MMKNIITILLLMCSVLMRAQSLSVSDFYLDEKDLTANTQGTTVIDQNGEKCALIKIINPNKGFTFSVGNLGVVKTAEQLNETWVYVPNGIRRITINHPQLGQLRDYNLPTSIEKARTYILKLTSEKVFVNNYNDTQKKKTTIRITPANSSFTLNGMSVSINNSGEVSMDLSYGTYTYKVESHGYYPLEGQLVVDGNSKSVVEISGLKPITGKLSVHVNPNTAKVSVDGNPIGDSSLEPEVFKIGQHEVTISANGYKPEKRTVVIKENETEELSVSLSQMNFFRFSTNPVGASVFVNKENIGNSPCSKLLSTGQYTIKATKAGYKDYVKTMKLNSSSPDVKISLSKIYNYKNELYAEANVRAGNYVAMGATIGGYFNGFNAEASYLYGTGESEHVYWCGTGTLPMETVYSPSTNIAAKVGYGVPLGSRFRFTPQVGLHFLKLTEAKTATDNKLGNGANAFCGLIGFRFSAAIIEHLVLSVSPEYMLPVMKSDGYKAISEVSESVEKWNKGINVKLGVAVTF